MAVWSCVSASESERSSEWTEGEGEAWAEATSVVVMLRRGVVFVMGRGEGLMGGG